MRKKLALGALALATSLGIAAIAIQDAWADGIPGGANASMYYAGFLEDEGVPVDGTPVIRVSVWTSAASGTGTELCNTASEPVTVDGGHFRIGLPATCVRAVQQNANVWTEVQIGSELPLPRQHIGAVPYAVEAANGVPPGTIVPYGGETPPPGWEACNGEPRSGAEGSPHRRLYLAIGEAWGDGDDGSGTMFHLPNLAGRFLRGAHGVGVDPDGDRAVASVQSDATRLPRTAFEIGGGAHSHEYQTFNYFLNNGADQNHWHLLQNPYTSTTGGTGEHTHTITGGDAETRPTNAAVLYIVKL